MSIKITKCGDKLFITFAIIAVLLCCIGALTVDDAYLQTIIINILIVDLIAGGISAIFCLWKYY